MTNAHLVAEINRMIRGIALNYPDGIPAIRAQLDAVARVNTFSDVPQVPVAPTAPESEPEIATPDSAPPVKRGPGRPPKYTDRPPPYEGLPNDKFRLPTKKE